MSTKEQLIELYTTKSKHSNYQILPRQLKKILNEDDLQTSTRYEQQRLEYILSKVNVRGDSVLDIGANTGFFSFELLDAGARKVHYYEGNHKHAEFVQLASDVLGLKNQLRVTNDYYLFDNSDTERYGIILLFNVLHHLGDDYGDKKIPVEMAKSQIIQQLNNESGHTSTLIYQMGFNWQGDINKPLFENGTKREMINFVKEGVAGIWDVDSIGIAVVHGKSISYEDLNDTNEERNDSLGEFLNRPIFILRPKTQNK